MTTPTSDSQHPTSATSAYATPGLLRRFAAMVYDSLLLMAVSILYGAIAVGVNLIINGAPATGERVQWGHWGIVVFIGWILTLLLFFCYFWSKSGQTLGMKTWRIKMFDAQSLQLPSLKQCLIRCVFAPISLLLLGAGYWLMYASPERQTLHDKISKTRLLLLSKEAKTK
jgi:uncharacterized RDD family membrane protein YckC